MRIVDGVLTVAATAAFGIPMMGGAAHASTTPTSPCAAVPEGVSLLVASEAGVSTVSSSGATPLSVPALPAPPDVAARGPDGTVWVGVTEADAAVPSGSSPSTYRISTSGTVTPTSTGSARLSSVGWLDGRTAAVIIDDDFDRGEGDVYGKVIVEFADGEQLDVGEAGGPEYGIGSMTLGANRLVESAGADLTEVISYSAQDGTPLEDWFTPTTEIAYNAPPLFQWAVAATDASGTTTRLSWVEGPDWDGETSTLVGGWSLVVADPLTGDGALRLDLGERPDSLIHADFDGRFWVGTFAAPATPGDEQAALAPAQVVVVDTAAPTPTAVDAGCTAGVTATIDRNGQPQPTFPAPPTATTSVPPTMAPPTTAARCSYVEADDAYPLRRCDKGAAVSAIQDQLVRRGIDVEIDGHFGPGTEQAVREFQGANDLEVDGLVGPDTWAALYTGTPGGTDGDGNGSIEPWEIGTPAPGGGSAESYIGLAYTTNPPSQDVYGPDGQPVAGLVDRGGWLIGTGADLPAYTVSVVRDADSTMLWFGRFDTREPDGSVGPTTVLDAIDVPLGPDDELLGGECALDGDFGQGIGAVGKPASVVDGVYTELSHAWAFDTASGSITPIDPAAVQCNAVGD